MTATIILGTYNGAKYLGEFLFSLEQQTSQDFNIFVSDDGSKDETVNILKASTFYRKNRMRIVSNNLVHGAAGNFINGVNNAPEADYYFFADQDDFWNKNKIEIMTKQISSKNNIIPQLLFSDLEIVDKQLHTISESYFSFTKFDPSKNNLSFPRILIENRIPGCAMCLNNKLITLMRNSVDPQKIVMHDYIALLIAAMFGEIHHTNQPLIQYRQHETNTIGAPQYSLSALMKRASNFYKKNGIHFYKHRHNQMILKENQASILTNFAAAKDNKHYALVHQFALLNSKNKIQRIVFLLKNKVFYDKKMETIQGLLTI